MSGKKERVDVLLVERGLVETREKAKRAVMAGLVYANEMRLDKPGEKIPQDTEITVKGQVMRYVSRGGYKLEKALETFHIDLQDKIMLDIGSSTGGFTDCALQNGAKLSYALDVGYNQLAWKLRQDERVVVMERTNFRYVTPADLQQGLPQFASIDVSFISLKLILPVLKTMLTPGGDVAALIKPQFEAGREQVGKKGIVRDRKVHEAVIEMIVDFALAEGYDVQNLTFSPITGGDGNIEFLIHLKWYGEREQGENQSPIRVEEVVTEAHEALKQKGKEE
ncbi:MULTISPECIES: TlyA family RNA methyltransferase [unclassified Bacillus (in: firmicutes)]|uniref:TlyA family RNA methyltransferase n=1 Tax=unclassified Bacillus (in: firmicutes) TaxID=185979 RepID=UPI0008E0AB6D|nr:MULTISPECIES: TlyA family RNA methyltransferase [unclassified Bacillus (in: firmicutes)]SFI50383.1 23S rRNA (cytidine1920-2'-O)/16S rRNA (cytidine1409-2'-O)-methyltransferase [Bacillus sp. 71mf]SFS48810.1 23S rRNA (cytidine1920-2'-O)/16S rRNA (cytidine1409-2'-O)-methyltransferase [Bacillus sp. 103mf]